MKILVIGIGEIGRHIASTLSMRGHDVVAIDKDKHKCEILSREADVSVYNRDATDPKLYEEIELETFDMVIATTDRDEVNLFVAAVAHEYGINKIIVITRTQEAAHLISTLGFATIVIPSSVISAKIVESYVEGQYSLLPVIKTLSGEYSIYTIAISPGDKAVGMKVGELKKELPKESMILAIFDGEKFIEPEDNVIIEENYILILLVPAGEEQIVEGVIR
ncbi:hypothetical protein EYM_03470 [Ignicoccus islandicus DSM 13165]|uniref:Potassium transporter TrkA n=1 Tax=Ignicoccus islandicus DSM 13165 TaxID=940295 RepID=A0A0U3EAV0_9CREN|nr:TrkA family potassium uptake protein [Ignicoccus islandicus]ALU12414.1 hypothetical protein EYM_03470 [Ignicoccus islandicus DSM 13165]